MPVMKKCLLRNSKDFRATGFFLGFLLGVVQMTVWMFWDPWWSLALGGMMVGYLTNFFAIKSIFEPLQPVQVVLGQREHFFDLIAPSLR